MNGGLRVTEDELRDLVVHRLKLVTPESFEAARVMAARLHLPLEHAIVQRGRVPLKFLLQQLASQWGTQFIDLKAPDVKPEALRCVREDYARSHMLIPFDLSGQELSVAMADPRDRSTLAELSRVTGLRIVPYLAPPDSIQRTQLLYRGNLLEMLRHAATTGTPVVAGTEGDTTARDLMQRLAEYAAVTGASDIHIEPFEHETLVRCRIDGILQEVLSAPASMIRPLTIRIKAISGMRVDDHRSPQDGRFSEDLGVLRLDFRASILPTVYGEKVALRVLARDPMALDLESLGLTDAARKIVLRNISRPLGMILVTGPTGSGKSTTLYAMLARLESDRLSLVNISTIEDPVELVLPRVIQVAVNPRAGIDFASGLRALLRQDPDIIMVGEIRDRETAEIATRAALVGRLLLSTLHTNDAASAIPRMLDMGVEPFVLASTLRLVIAQRLVRRICDGCREAVDDVTTAVNPLLQDEGIEEALRALRQNRAPGDIGDSLAGVRLLRGRGCNQCGESGYRGRIGLFEALEIDEEIRQMIIDRRDAPTIRAAAIRRGMKTMLQDGLAKALKGETTIEEVVRAAV
jgi:type IV pilus assembly protein PilB